MWPNSMLRELDAQNTCYAYNCKCINKQNFANNYHEMDILVAKSLFLEFCNVFLMKLKSFYQAHFVTVLRQNAHTCDFSFFSLQFYFCIMATFVTEDVTFRSSSLILAIAFLYLTISFVFCLSSTELEKLYFANLKKMIVKIIVTNIRTQNALFVHNLQLNTI